MRVRKCLLFAVIAVAGGCTSPKTDSFRDGYEAEKGKIAARSEKADADRIKRLEDAVYAFRVDVGRLPTAQEGLQALIIQPDNANDWKGPYCKASDLDPESGKLFAYESSGESFSIKVSKK